MYLEYIRAGDKSEWFSRLKIKFSVVKKTVLVDTVYKRVWVYEKG